MTDKQNKMPAVLLFPVEYSSFIPQAVSIVSVRGNLRTLCYTGNYQSQKSCKKPSILQTLHITELVPWKMDLWALNLIRQVEKCIYGHWT